MKKNISKEKSGKTLRFKADNGEYVYAIPQEILVAEVFDKVLRVLIVKEGHAKWASKCISLKKFLADNPENTLAQLHRSFAIDRHRVSSGSKKKRTIEFDFRYTITLPDKISNRIFSHIAS